MAMIKTVTPVVNYADKVFFTVVGGLVLLIACITIAYMIGYTRGHDQKPCKASAEVTFPKPRFHNL